MADQVVYPFPMPLVALPNRSPREDIIAWVMLRMPYQPYFDKANDAIYQSMRKRKNSGKTYHDLVDGVEKGGAARVAFCEKAAVSK